MPLPPPTVNRKLIHTRTITCTGYDRADGAWDVDGWLIDAKAHGFDSPERGHIPPGEPIHSMGLRLAVTPDMKIKDALAVQDYSPYRICPAITPSFRNLKGLSLTRGFKKSVRDLFGGVKGCVHLVDILGPIATTLFQTSIKRRLQKLEDAKARGQNIKPAVLDTCHAWSSDGPVVKREFPVFYTGKD